MSVARRKLFILLNWILKEVKDLTSSITEVYDIRTVCREDKININSLTFADDLSVITTRTEEFSIQLSTLQETGAKTVIKVSFEKPIL